jgi:hypothetical protein
MKIKKFVSVKIICDIRNEINKEISKLCSKQTWNI